jgi:lactate permease
MTSAPWVQVYDPLHSLGWSTLLATPPLLVLLGLIFWGVPAHRAALCGLVTAMVTAIVGFHMPWVQAVAAAVYGACCGLLPIGWIVLPGLFLFHLTVRSGQFEIVKRSVTALSPDRRMQALLIAFSFGAFLEGAAGFGTPAAISSALLMGIGFSPLYAAGLALMANTSPVAFGSLGSPITVLAKVSDLPEMALSQMVGRQLPLFALIVPVWLIWTMSGWKGVKGCWPAILVCGGSYGACQFVVANFAGPSLAGVGSGLLSLVVLAAFLRVWQPREVFRFANERGEPVRDEAPPLTSRQVAHAWVPWLLLSAMIFVWGLPQVKTALDGGTAKRPNCLAGIGKLAWSVPRLDGAVYRTSPVVQVPPGSDRAEKPMEAIYDFNWLSAAGTAIFLAAVISAFWLRIRPREFAAQLLDTTLRVRPALLTIACTLAIAFILKFSGGDATLGLAFTHTGWLYPLFAPLLGWVGVAITGSDTASNALFGSLQHITAKQLALNPVLIVASNSTGGVMAKMIAAQSIAVAAVATEQSGQEGRILRFVLLPSIIMALIVGLMTLVQAYLLPWTIPGG